jgi:hypothetical protein
MQKAQVYLAMDDTAAAVKALAETIKLNPKAYQQILRNDTFKPIWDNASFRALGDYSKFAELKPSNPGKTSMPMPAIP